MKIPTFPAVRLASMVPRNIRKVPKSYLKHPKLKKPKVSDFKRDMDNLGAEIAEEFKETVIDNIKTNYYGFHLSASTLRQKSGETPLIDSGVMLDAIYREGTYVSVENTPRTDSPLTNLELAKVHEYGTKDRHIPARPVWRYTFRDYKPKAKKRIQKFFKTHGNG